MANYQLWLTDDRGYKLEMINQFNSLVYIITPSNLGWFTLSVPYDRESMAADWRRPDRQIHIYRAPNGGDLAREAIYFIQKWRFYDRGGDAMMDISGAGLNDILNRRIVAYYAESAQSQMTSVPADDMMKRLVNDALGSDSNTDYDGAIITGRDVESFGFSIQAESSGGASISKAFAWRGLLPTLKAIKDQTRVEVEEVFFDIVPTGIAPLTCEFRTYIGKRGSDRTRASNSPLRFGREWGNVDRATMSIDYSKLQNHIYVGGKGRFEDRIIEEVKDGGSEALSVWARREGFLNNQSTDDTSLLTASGNTRLAEKARDVRFSASIKDTPYSPYGGKGWRAGDKITISYLGRDIDAIIRSVRVTVDNRGEKIMGSVSV